MPTFKRADQEQFEKAKDLIENLIARLKDLAVGADTLRDPQLARFKTEDVRRVELSHGGQDLVFVKDKDSLILWTVE